jgi:hypothetical protein
VAAGRRQRKGEGNEGIRVWVLLGLHGFGSRVVFKKRNGSFCKSTSEEAARGARGGAAVRHTSLETRGEQQSQGAFKNCDNIRVNFHKITTIAAKLSRKLQLLGLVSQNYNYLCLSFTNLQHFALVHMWTHTLVDFVWLKCGSMLNAVGL